MRVALTALDAARGMRADLLVSFDEGASVHDVALALRDALAGVPDPHGGGAPNGGRDGAAGEPEHLAIVIRHPRFTGQAPAPAPAGGARAPVVEAPATAQQALTLWVDGRMLAAELPAGRALRDGMVVALGSRYAPATDLGEPTGVVEVRVSGGPAAGSVHRLGLGRFALGADPACAVALGDPAVPPHAATLTVGPAGVTVEPVPGRALALEGGALDAATPWPYGSVLAVGDSLLTLQLPEEADASLTPTDDGGLAYNRPPRLLPPRRGRRLAVPEEPKAGDGPRFGLLAMVLPAIAGVALAVLFKQMLYLAFALLGPISMLANYLSDRHSGRKRHGGAMRQYQQAMRDHQATLEELRAADEVERRQAAPDPATLLLVATGPRRRLWERRGGDPDALSLRLGTGDLPAAIELASRGGPDEAPPRPPLARHVPVALDLGRLGVIGVAGDRAACRGVARWLVAQAAVLHSPRDLSIEVLAPGHEAAADWEWVRWLPHCRPRDGQDCVALVGVDAETVSRRVAELVDEISRRRRQRAPLSLDGGADQGPAVLLVLDGARALRRVPGMPQVLAEGPAVGIHAICVDDDERLLPEECRAAATWLWDEPARLRLRGGGLDPVGTLLADQVGTAWCERVARALAPVRDLSREDAAGMLPDSARLLDLLGMPDPDAEQVEAAWARQGRTTVAPLGYAADGAFELDLRRDGPHALVAGTTGAGKSELLQTLIASLAVANRPDAMSFVLIDYKGGSAFKDCARLPHTVGMVTDLDGHLTQRALASLSAELKRREEILLHAGAKDIEDYWDARRRQPGLQALPRLVLIIDEFASLVAELPEFVRGLVGIAQRGRSLGVHLVLATQRPAGVVSADIRANTNLRIALRVTDAAESSDVIDAPDAAAIAKSTPGRCYVRSGASSLTAVQAARVGGRRPGGRTAASRPAVARVGWGELGRPAPRVAGAGEAAEDDASTDLSVLVEAVREATGRLRVATPPSPWLPPLGEGVTVAELPRPAAEGIPAGEPPPLPYALIDVPAEQRRDSLPLDLVDGGHLLVAGSARSGRSTVLRTIAGAIGAATSPADVHLYAVDCGSGALLPLVGLPHCGAVVSRDQPERVDRLLGRLLAEVSRRQQLLAERGASSLVEQRAAAAPDERLPWMVLMLDRWEGFRAAFESYDLGRLLESALRLLREGASVGLRAVLTSDASGFVGQVSTVFEERLLLRFADPDDWGRAGVPAREVPSSMPPGRGLVPTAAGLLEAQVALLDPDPSGPAQVAALQAVARQARERHGAVPRPRRPLRVDALPPRIGVAEALALDPELDPPSPLWALLGAGGDALAPTGVDLLQTSPGFVIGGPPRSGRSTALETMARWLLRRQVPVALVTPRRSPLRELAALPGVLGVLDSGDGEPERLGELLRAAQRHVVLVDDAELLLDTGMGERLAELVRAARDADQAVVAAGTTEDLNAQYRGFVVDIRRSRSGLLLSPQSPSDGDLLGVRLPRNMAAGPPGRGLLVVNAAVTPVQVAVPER